MRNYLIVIFMTICSSYLSAQIDYYDQLKSQYDQLRKEEKYDSALVVTKQMSDWALQNETDTSLRYAVSLRYMGNCYNNLQIGDSTLFYWDSSLSALEKQNRSETLDAGYCYFNKVTLYSNNDNVNAIVNFVNYLEIIKKSLGEGHSDYASSLKSLGDLYYVMGDYETAEPYYIQALNVYKKSLGEEHSDYESSLKSLGDLYYVMGDFETAEPYYL